MKIFNLDIYSCGFNNSMELILKEDNDKISSSCGKIEAVDSCISDIEKKIKLLSYQKNHIKK